MTHELSRAARIASSAGTRGASSSSSITCPYVPNDSGEGWSNDDLGEVEEEGFEWPAEEYEQSGLDRIHERMDAIAEQQAALAEQLEGDVDAYYDAEDEDFDHYEYDDVEVGAPDVLNLVEDSLNAREAEYEAEYDIQDATPPSRICASRCPS